MGINTHALRAPTFSLTQVFHCLPSCLSCKLALHANNKSHTHVNMDGVCLCREMPPCKMKHKANGLQNLCVCVFSFLPVVPLKLLSVLLRQLVTDLSLPVFLCLSTCLSLLLSFHYISPLSLFISPPTPTRPPPLSAALFFHFVSLLSPPQLCSKNPSI